MKRIFSMLVVAMAFFVSCEKQGGQEVVPPQEEPSDFTIEQTALTQGSMSVRIIPVDNEAPYYFNVLSQKDFKEKYDGQKDVMAKAYLDWFTQMASAAGMSLESFLSDALLSGMQSRQFRALAPETDYVFFAFGVDYSGNLTTDIETYDFTTLKPQLKKDAKISIELLQAAPTWFKVKFDCSDPDIFYYYDVMDPSVYEQYCGSDPAGITTYMTDYLNAMKSENDTFKAMTMAEFITALTVSGEKEYDTALSEAANSLLPEMEYPVFAIGLANDGSFTTDPVVVMVSTTETEPNDWIMYEKETKLTDISYTTIIYPKWDEVYAVVLERSLYFDGLDDQRIVDELLAARKGTFIDDLYVGRSEFSAINLIPDEDYTLCLIACTPDGLPKTGKKLNIKKIPVKTKQAVATGATYSIKVYDITKTEASVSITGNDAAKGQTFILNYVKKSDFDALIASEGSETAAFKKDCDMFIDNALKAWNDSKPDNAKMDRKEFLSRALMGDDDLLVGSYMSFSDLESGTQYYMYAVGMKADGSYTTEPFYVVFNTIADINSQISITVGMTAWMYDEYYPGKTNYTVSAIGNPYDKVGGVYCMFFTGNDEWTGKSAAEIKEELLKKQAGLWGSATANLTVDRGTEFFVYFIGVDTENISTDIKKVSHTSKVEGSVDTGMGKDVTIDKVETVSVR